MDFADHLATADAASVKALGRSITYAPAVGDPVSVEGIFDEVYRRVDLQDPGVSATGPAIFLVLSDLPADPSQSSTERQGARVTVGSKVYSIWEAAPDGMGGILLHLTEV